MKRAALALLLALSTPAAAAGLSEHDNAVHNFAHVGLGACAGVVARLWFIPIEKQHPYWAGLGYVAAGAAAQLAYKAIYDEIRDPRLGQVTAAGAAGGLLIALGRIDINF